VQADAQLQSMVQAELDRRRAELQQKQQGEQQDQPSSKPPPEYRSSVSQCDTPGWRATREDYPEYRPGALPAPPDPTPPAPDPDQVAFSGLVQAFRESLASGNEDAARATWDQMRTLHEKSGGAISASELERYRQRIEKLRARVEEFRSQIDTMAREAVAAARRGDAEAAAKLMHHLSVVHAAHPRLLDEPGLEDVRRDVVNAADERCQHRLTTHKLLKRERAIVAEIKKLADAVRDFHQVACTVPDTSEEFRKAEATYLRAIQEVRTYDTEWFSGVVLELADLLADWTVPPQGAEGQIDRFLDSISAGLDSIRAEMREIESEQDLDGGDESESAAP
jgi:ribosomal protein S20